ncbi:MAG: thioredoxin domain-containing protein [Thermoplasmatota archaeon]
MKKRPFVNHLAGESSPYLRQHVHNPVDWHPWGDRAFMKAMTEDRPIFLSIGYSTCHWCHVMAHESFEDPEVAEKMNRTFVSIKVDREERPDIDSVYMKASVLATGGGGWPLTVLMTPKGEPFFVATYIPKRGRYGTTGLLEILDTIERMWNDDREKLLRSADSIREALRTSSTGASGNGIDEGMVERAFLHFKGTFDRENGGFGRAPKFPSPHNLIFLLRHWWRTGNRDSLDMAVSTMKKMRSGGIYDHVGGGFHRYSTDPEWRLPHFEKMLYDQAMLVMAYTEGYLATRDPIFKETVEGILEYVLGDLRSPEGAFYSAEDADSEGEEGKFYVWTMKELLAVLGGKSGKTFCEMFDVKEGGNFRDEATGRVSGANVLNSKDDPLDIEMNGMLKALSVERQKRQRPSLDDKVLVDWNSLMISALSRAFQVFGRREYLDAAVRAADLMLERTVRNGKVEHMLGNGPGEGHGFIDDHAFFLNALLDLYESNFDARYIREAKAIADGMIERFRDLENGGFFISPVDGEELLVREKEAYDGAYPSGNSVAMLGLVRLSRMTGLTKYEEEAFEIGKAFTSDLKRAPWGFTQMLSAFMHASGPAREIVIGGRRNSTETEDMLRIVRETYFPSKVVLLKDPRDDMLGEVAPFTLESVPLKGKTTAYVCQGWNCDVPSTDPKELAKRLQER